jgi:hypothetical protein
MGWYVRRRPFSVICVGAQLRHSLLERVLLLRARTENERGALCVHA